MDSGSAGAQRPGGRLEWPAMDSAAAMNQLSNSIFARTTPTGRRPAAVRRARVNSSGASSFGQLSSLSIIISTDPGTGRPLTANSTAPSIPPSRNSVPLGFLIGRCTFAYTAGFTSSTRRRIRIGTAGTSPWPSTMQATEKASIYWERKTPLSGVSEGSRDPGSSLPIRKSSPAV